MSVKRLNIADIGEVSFYKRRGLSNLKLNVKPDGQIRVSMPTWVPFSAGIEFARKHRDWINSKITPVSPLSSGSRIGKAHQLIFLDKSSAQRISTRLDDNLAKVFLPTGIDSASAAAQAAATKISQKALKVQADQLLPSRLAQLATQHGFEYRSLTIRQLKSRWGSCSQHGDIVLSYYLMQLPWNLIDYVMLHELTHTKVHSHSKNFWAELETKLPGVKQIRREIRQFSPSVTTAVDSYAKIA